MRTSMTKLSLAFMVTAIMAVNSLCVAQESTSTSTAEVATADAVAVADDTKSEPAESAATKKEAREQLREDRMTEKRLSRIWKTSAPVEGFESTEMFAAMKDGEINVLVKTISEKKSNLIVTNTSDKPLAIAMPETFAVRPRVLAQQGFGGGGQGGFGGQGGQGGFGRGGQVGGGGFGGGQGGGGFGGGQGGFGGGGGGVFNIPAGKVGKLSLTTVCLEHGKPNPNVKMDYEIVPLTEFTSDGSVAEICRMLATDEVAQSVAQAAAWNLTDDISWQEMLTMNRLERMDGYFERFFTPEQLTVAQRVVTAASERSEKRADNDHGDDDMTVSVGEQVTEEETVQKQE